MGPTAILTIEGNGTVDGFANAIARFTANDLGGVIIGSITGNTAYIGSNANSVNGLRFFTNSSTSTVLQLTNSGNVGIGTVSPSDKLDVNGNINIDTSSVYKIGTDTVLSNIGTNTIFVGVGAGSANTTGSENTFMGREAGYANTTGEGNTFLGFQAGNLNTTGSNITLLGKDADVTVATLTNATALGANASATASNQVRIGDASVTSIGGYANWSNVSDARFKTNVKENVPGLEFIGKLHPITYTLKIDELNEFLGKADQSQAGETAASSIVHTGFIAQQVENAAKKLGFSFSGVDVPKNENDHYGLRYAAFVVPLVKGMQEQQEMIKKLRETVNKQQEVFVQQQKMIQQLQYDIAGLKTNHNKALFTKH